MLGNIYIFKTTLKQQIILLAHLLFIWVALILGIVYILKSRLDNIAAFYTFLFVFLTDTLPTIIVHTQYWLKNRNVILILNTGMKELVCKTPIKQFKYSFSDIISMDYYRNLGKGSGWNSFSMYRYYRIVFKDKTEVVITCLMINDIENTLEMLLRIKAERHSKLLCLIT